MPALFDLERGNGSRVTDPSFESVERLLKMLFLNVSLSVAVLLAVFGSVTRLGVVTVAVFEIEPLAEALMVPVAL